MPDHLIIVLPDVLRELQRAAQDGRYDHQVPLPDGCSGCGTRTLVARVQRPGPVRGLRRTRYLPIVVACGACGSEHETEEGVIITIEQEAAASAPPPHDAINGQGGVA